MPSLFTIYYFLAQYSLFIMKGSLFANHYTPSRSSYQSMPHMHVTLNGVIRCVKRLNPKKTCRPDKMPILAQQETVNEIAPVPQSIFQQSLNESKTTSDWKKANIVPIFKKGDRTKPTNYRPYSSGITNA